MKSHGLSYMYLWLNLVQVVRNLVEFTHNAYVLQSLLIWNGWHIMAIMKKTALDYTFVYTRLILIQFSLIVTEIIFHIESHSNLFLEPTRNQAIRVKICAQGSSMVQTHDRQSTNNKSANHCPNPVLGYVNIHVHMVWPTNRDCMLKQPVHVNMVLSNVDIL